jgi:hypothetical protein
MSGSHRGGGGKSHREGRGLATRCLIKMDFSVKRKFVAPGKPLETLDLGIWHKLAAKKKGAPFFRRFATMSLKTNGGKMSDFAFATMLLKIHTLTNSCHYVIESKCTSSILRALKSFRVVCRLPQFPPKAGGVRRSRDVCHVGAGTLQTRRGVGCWRHANRHFVAQNCRSRSPSCVYTAGALDDKRSGTSRRQSEETLI